MNNIKKINRFFQGKYTGNFSTFLSNLKTPRDAIAISLNIPYSTYDNYVRGESSFPIDLLWELYRATVAMDGDVVLNYIGNLFGKTFVSKESGNGDTEDTTALEMETMFSCNDAVKEDRRAREDGKIEKKEYKKIHRKTNKGRQLLAEIDERAKRDAR